MPVAMGGKNPALVVAGLLLVLVALCVYQWLVLSENTELKQQTDRAREQLGQLQKERVAVQNRLAEISMALDDKKRYISDLDGKFLKANAGLESKIADLQRCTEEKKKVAENQKNELKAKDDQQKKLEGEKKKLEDEKKKLEEEKNKVQTDLEEFKTLCTVADMTKDLAKKLCPQQPVVQPKK